MEMATGPVLARGEVMVNKKHEYGFGRWTAKSVDYNYQFRREDCNIVGARGYSGRGRHGRLYRTTGGYGGGEKYGDCSPEGHGWVVG